MGQTAGASATAETTLITADDLEFYKRDPLREKRLNETDSVVCRECGERYKWLYDHVRTHGMEPEAYSHKYDCAPLFAERHRQGIKERAKKRTKELGDKLFHTKDGVDKTARPMSAAERAKLRAGKPTSTRMLRHMRELHNKARGQRRSDSSSRRPLSFHTSDGYKTVAPIEDASVAQLVFEGKTVEQIGSILNRSIGTLGRTRKRIGLPSRNFPPYRGHPFCAKDIWVLAGDLGISGKRTCTLLNVSYRFVKNAAQLEARTKGKRHNWFSRAWGVPVVVEAIQRMLENHCYHLEIGKRVRDFLQSVINLIQTTLPVLEKGLAPLIGAIKSKQLAINDSAILNWICAQSRSEVARERNDSSSEQTFRTLLLFWPAFKTALQKPGNRFRRSPEEAASDILADAFCAAPFRVREAAAGRVQPLQPDTLRLIFERRLAGIPAGRSNESFTRLGCRRRGRPSGISPGTKQRLRLVAAIRLSGRSLRSMAKYVFPDTPESAESNSYRLESEHRKAIKTLMQAMTETEAKAILHQAIGLI